MDYPYANGVVKAIEARLLDRARIAKLSKSDKNGFLKALADVGYGRIAPGDGVETAIARDLRDFHVLLDEITPDKKATDLFFLMEDALNLKILLKRKRFAAPVYEDAGVDGTIPFSGLAKAIADGDDTELAPRFRPLVGRLLGLAPGCDAGTLSAAVDRELFAFAFKAIGIFPNEALLVYLQAKADFANVLAAFRMKKLGWSFDRFADVFIAGGLYPLETFTSVFGLSFAEAARALNGGYDEKVSRLLADYTDKRGLGVLETGLSDLLVDRMNAYRDDSFAIGPIICYHLEKTREADLVRSLYARAASDRSAV